MMLESFLFSNCVRAPDMQEPGRPKCLHILHAGVARGNTGSSCFRTPVPAMISCFGPSGIGRDILNRVDFLFSSVISRHSVDIFYLDGGVLTPHGFHHLPRPRDRDTSHSFLLVWVSSMQGRVVWVG